MAATAYRSYDRNELDFDVEKGAAALNAFAERTVRQGFVKKVFGLLAAQLALTTLIAGSFVLSSGVKAFVAANPWVFMLSFIASISIILSFTFSVTARQSHPLNLVLLFAFTAAEGVLVGAASAQVSTDIVLLALGITAGITAGMCLYALTTKHDITMAGSFLYAGLMALIFASLAGFFLKTSAFNMLVSGAGAVLFSVYIAYDVQMLLGGEHKFAVSPDDYVMGTIAIYLDIINLFLHILRLLSSNNRE